MIRMLVKIASFLDRRFPEKRVVTAQEYDKLNSLIQAAHTELSDMTSRLENIEKSAEATIRRLSVVEQSAVHKAAVQEVIKHVELVKEEMTALKFGLGLDRPQTSKDAEINAVLNGQPLLGDNNG